MGKWRNPLSGVRSTTVGIIGLTVLWTVFQMTDKSPPPVLDQILVAAFGVWFATEAKYNNKRHKKSNQDDEVEEDDDE